MIIMINDKTKKSFFDISITSIFIKNRGSTQLLNIPIALYQTNVFISIEMLIFALVIFTSFFVYIKRF